jgi:SAM-dependent methyltransferase
MNAFNWHPGSLLETSGAYWQSCILHTAVKLDLFSLLETKALAAPEVAKCVQGDLRGVTMLLNALCAMDLLEQRQSRYRNTAPAADFLVRNADRYLGHIILHHHFLMDSWNNLEQGVLQGKPQRRRPTTDEVQRRTSFLMGMFNLASLQAPQVAATLDLSRARRLLDLGGGPGTYAIHFALANKGLCADIFDLPTTEPLARQTVARFNLQSRIDFQAGDYLQDPIEGRYDVVWLSHILHAEAPSDGRRLLTKAIASLVPGGLIYIHDFFLESSMDAPFFPAIFALNMLLGTDGGQSYSEAQVVEMLTTLGVEAIERLPYEGPNQSGILVGRVALDSR